MILRLDMVIFQMTLQKKKTFFYHSDHLGSTSYIMDDHANITQYDAYLPYGELLVDEHSSLRRPAV